MMADPFKDFDRRFAASQRRFDLMFRVVTALIAALWILGLLAVVATAVTVVRLGSDGLAAEAGRLVGVFERSWEQAR